jgi:hypothetical protein
VVDVPVEPPVPVELVVPEPLLLVAAGVPVEVVAAGVRDEFAINEPPPQAVRVATDPISTGRT